jgi:hypothetical protein
MFFQTLRWLHKVFRVVGDVSVQEGCFEVEFHALQVLNGHQGEKDLDCDAVDDRCV